MQAVTEASPIHKLPFDTLNVIFLYSVPYPPKPIRLARPWFRTQQRGLEDIFFSITLAAVCSEWRFVAFSTPQLWTHFEFPESLWEHKCVPYHILSLYFDNSKNLPIHLSISFRGYRPPDGVLFHRSLDHALISSLTRIQSLSLCNPPLSWLKQLGKLASILDLSLDWPDSALIPENYPLIPHPHARSHTSSSSTSIKNIGRVVLRVPTTLTILELAGIQVDVCIKIMLGCPNLVEAYIHDPHIALDKSVSYEELQETWFSQPVIFHHLTIFRWTEYYSVWKNAFFEGIKTPQLHTFIISANALDIDGMELLIQQFPDTLKILQLEDLDYVPVTDFDCLLNANSSVEHLIMSKCNLEVVKAMFHTLLRVDETSGLVHVPQLKALTLEDCDNGCDTAQCWLGTEQFDITFDQLFEALESRLNQGDIFKLDLIDFVFDWSPCTQERLKKLAEKGVQLEILEDENPVEWL